MRNWTPGLKRYKDYNSAISHSNTIKNNIQRVIKDTVRKEKKYFKKMLRNKNYEYMLYDYSQKIISRNSLIEVSLSIGLNHPEIMQAINKCNDEKYLMSERENKMIYTDWDDDDEEDDDDELESLFEDVYKKEEYQFDKSIKLKEIAGISRTINYIYSTLKNYEQQVLGRTIDQEAYNILCDWYYKECVLNKF